MNDSKNDVERSEIVGTAELVHPLYPYWYLLGQDFFCEAIHISNDK